MTNSIDVVGLTPNENYSIQIFATRTDANGTVHTSPYSLPLQISTPAYSSSGSNLATVNSTTDTQLSGGSVYAGTFPSNIGQLNVVTGTTTGTGVVLNSSGLAGFANGTKEFYIDSATGRAYFAGTLTAGTIKIGPLVDPSNSKNGIYINSKNYWYDDGSFSATSIDVAGTLLNTTDPTSIPKPAAVTNLTSSWSGTTLNISWQWTAGTPDFSKDFILSFTEGGLTKSVIVPISSRSYSFTLTENQSTFGFVSTVIGLSIVVEDRFGNQSTATTAAGATYVSSLSAPSITVTSVNNGYSVAWNAQSSPSFDAISIEEVESNSPTDPGTGYNVVYAGTLNPAIIVAPDLNKRWVRARFVDSIGGFTTYSSAYAITPTSPVTVNNTIPTDVTVASGAITWSGNNIVVPYTLPSSNAGTRFLITLTAPGGATGYFYFNSDGTSNLSQTHTITQSDLKLAFGQYYASFTGTFYSFSNTNVQSGGTSIIVPSISNSLSGVTPTPTVTAIVDGYNIVFTNTTSNVSYAEVYEFYLDPTTEFTALGDVPDFMDASFVSGGTSGSSSITVNNFTDDSGASINPVGLYGMKISGTGISTSSPVWVTSVTASGSNYIINLSSPLQSQASGNYHMQVLVASGSSPLVVYTSDYLQRWVSVVYYDIYGNNSKFSGVQTVTPTNPTTSLISSAVQVGGSGGAIYVGAHPDSGARVVLGANSGTSGIFAWDANDSTPSTSIIASPAGGLTFNTQNALIADWTISTNKIESTLISGITKYTGLSASNTNYAFWAGATSSSNSDNSAPFSVTPLGAVTAKNITITGGSLNVNNNFKVDTSGVLNATGATISGAITANSGTFHGNVNIDSTGSLYSGALDSSGNIQSGTAGYILNSHGLIFSNTSTSGVTKIDATTGLFTTTSANIGGWSVGNPNITATQSNGTITLDSSNARITANTTSGGNYYVGMAAPTSSSSIVMWAGTAGVASSSNAFVVRADGTVTIGGTSASSFITGSQVNSNVTSISGGVIKSGTIDLSQGATIGTGGSSPVTISSSGISSTNFKINSSGSVNFVTGTIGSFTVDGNGIYIGGTSFAGSNIALTNSGNVISGGVITGTVFAYTGITSTYFKGNAGSFPTFYANNSGWTSNGLILPGDGVSGNGSSGSYGLGTSSFRWGQIYTNASVNTGSDRRLKTDIKTAELGLNFINKLNPVSYKLIEASKKEIKDAEGNVLGMESVPGVRRHYGLIAQDVKSVLNELTSDPSNDFAGWAMADKDDENSEQALVYSEFIIPLISSVQELSNKINILQSQLDNLNK